MCKSEKEKYECCGQTFLTQWKHTKRNITRNLLVSSFAKLNSKTNNILSFYALILSFQVALKI